MDGMAVEDGVKAEADAVAAGTLGTPDEFMRGARKKFRPDFAPEGK